MSRFYQVSKVLATRVGPDGLPEYRVRWRGYGASQDSWVREDDVNEAIRKFERKHETGKRKVSVLRS